MTTFIVFCICVTGMYVVKVVAGAWSEAKQRAQHLEHERLLERQRSEDWKQLEAADHDNAQDIIDAAVDRALDDVLDRGRDNLNRRIRRLKRRMKR